MADTPSNKSAANQLKQFFDRNGYVRIANAERVAKLGWQKYKKGYEVRLVAKNRTDLAQIRLLLEQVGFKAGKSYENGKQIILPIYGRAAVEWFLGSKLK